MGEDGVYIRKSESKTDKAEGPEKRQHGRQQAWEKRRRRVVRLAWRLKEQGKPEHISVKTVSLKYRAEAPTVPTEAACGG